MDDTFSSYLQQLQLIAFFSGYPLVYALASVIAGRAFWKRTYGTKLHSLLPYSYALVATLYLGLQIKTHYPYYSSGIGVEPFRVPFLVVWGLLANIFWLPLLAKRPVISLLHSLIFFLLIGKDILLQITQNGADRHTLLNDMKLYTLSLFIHIAALVMVFLVSFVFRSLRNKE